MIKCQKCNRELPNKKIITDNGCLWCDNEYHWNKKKDVKQKKVS